jgi:glycosyltransferase involved in cell wall biosynthesis
MRLVLDVQARQTDGSGYRGVGRYSEGLAIHIARQRGEDDVRICLNAAYPDSIRTISASLQASLGRERISSCLDPEFANASSPSVDDALREALIRRHWIALQPDVLHVSHVFENFGPAAVVPHAWPRIPGMVRSSTLYDLIPLRFPEHYLADPAFKAWYLAKLEILRDCDHLLAISETSRLDAIELLGLPGDRISTIWGGVDEGQFRPRVLAEDEIRSFRARHGLNERYLLHTGGDDYRKNLEGAIAGFAEVPRQVRQDVQLAIVCRLSDERRAVLANLVARSGLAAADVVLTGFVSDDDLARFYNTCEAFVFPSLYEGLGLPVLEAMKSGAVVLGGRNSSIRELIGDEDALFDARQPASMARQLVRVLGDEDFRRHRREDGLERARLFTWERTASLALGVLRAARAAAMPRATAVLVDALPRRRMALFTPLPPCRSGIADYNAAFLPHLARHFAIDIFVDGYATSDANLQEHFTIYPHQDFDEKSAQYDVVVYEMGNSEFHAYMLPHISRHPGVVVLHDAYLSGLYGYLDFQCGERGRYIAEMLGAHGPRARRYLAPVEGHPDPIGGSMADLPATRSVIDQAIGLIAHSPSSLDVARDAYPEGFAAPYRIIKQMVKISAPTDAASKAAARETLGFGVRDVVVASFGHMTWTKCGDRLLDAFLHSSLSENNSARLLFVGELAQGAFGNALRERIEKSGLGERIRVTGYVDESTYARYLGAVDVAVQLRTDGRGETSKAVLDCLAAAVPVIVNDAVSYRDYPDHVVQKIAADPDSAQLARCLLSLLADPDALGRIGAAGRNHAIAEHTGERIAAQYALAIDEMLQRQAAASLAGGIHEVGGLLATNPASDSVVAASARALQAMQPAMLFRTRRLLVDVSIIADKDHGTGVQRVVNAIVRQLYVSKRGGFSPLAVRLHDGHMVEATGWLAAQGLLTETEQQQPAPAAVGIERGDTLLMLDSSWDRFGDFADVFAAVRAANGLVYTAIYDLLPVRMPKSFLPGMVSTFRHWLEQAIAQSDGLVCISRAVADDVCDFLLTRSTAQTKAMDIGYWHLGADFIPEAEVQPQPSPAIEAALAGRTLLMVGTIEPRKNHALALDAMERLWDRGVDINLCVAGRTGWLTDTVMSRVKRHRELGRRLRWLASPSDGDLQYAYRKCAGLLFLSAAEGFGLPLVEAARFGIPIASADIPVAREICGPHAAYVPLTSADALANAMGAWLISLAAGSAPKSIAMPVLTWEESAESLLGVILDQRWYRSIRPETSPGIASAHA